MPSKSARCCVVTPALNARSTIARAVSSALAQAEASEVVVVDDGSTDGTAEAARQADDGTGRLVVLSLKETRGPSAARNLALDASRAEWVCPLDADDYFLPGRLGRMLDQAAGCDLVADDLYQVSSAAPEEPARRLIGERMPLPAQLTFAQFVRANISRRGRPRCELGFLKPLMRREFLEAHGLRYDERLRFGEDFIFYATGLALGARFKLVEPCGYVAVERPESLSGRHTGADLQRLLIAHGELAQRSLPPSDAAILRRHRRHLAAKAKLREVLDARRSDGLAGAARSLLGAPAEAPYVLTQILQEKLRRFGRAAPAPAGRGRLRQST